MPMAVTNEQVARVLEAHADALGLDRANPYRVRAYQKAARAIAAHKKSVAQMVAGGEDLRAIPGVGEGLAKMVAEIVATGKLPVAAAAPRVDPGRKGDAQASNANPAAAGLAKLGDVGPKRAGALAAAGFATLEDVERAAREGRLRGLPGFGAALEKRLLEALEQRARSPDQDVRRIRPLVVYLERRLARAIAKAPGVERLEAAGSFRRKRDTVADLDFVAVGGAAAAMDALAAQPEVGRVLNRGPTKSSVQLTKGMQVDLRVVPPESWGAALLYFTGSKEHNVRLRALAQGKGWKLNEYGLFDGDRRIAGATEDEVYEALGLPFIAPELREDRGEVEAALAGKLPTLVTREDLKGDLHTHTNWTDGANTLETMAKAARSRGLEYIAVTDHTPRTAIAGGMPWARHQKQHRLVDELNRQYGKEGLDFRILKGAEVDILKDGRLDLPVAGLAGLDVVVASLHFRERQSPKELTDRVLKAMGTGVCDILGHPSGRLLGKRPGMEHDWTRVLDAAKDQGWAVECDGSPWRQDLWGELLHQAKTSKVKVALDSDAHSTSEFDYLEWAVDQGRRGWLEPKDVLNTRSAKQLLKLLA
jgi:DNA polymerase (family X)